MTEEVLVENEALAEAYKAELGPRRFGDPNRVHVAMGVYTTDLSEGRGDVYVAVGLGRQLKHHGYEIIYLGRDEWYDLPEGTDIFLSMLAEPSVMLDPLRLPAGVRRIAWARNNTDRWVASPHLAVYDAVLCSSEISQRAIERVYPGPTGILRIGVDPDLFTRAPRGHAGGDADARPRATGAGDETGDAEGYAGDGDAPAGGDRRHGVVSTVNQWGGERQLYAALRQIDIDHPLDLYGTQRGIAPELEPYTRDPASYFALPSVYRQAEIVLDDQQDVNRGYGNVNSRIYESLACGALPITNTRLGLDRVGLGDLPAYGTPAELERLVREFRADEARREELVERCRQVVLDEHTYTSRARKLDAYLRELPRADHRVVAFYPDYRATNPYQDMLYSAGPDNGIASCPAVSNEDLSRLSSLLEERLVLHVHWTATVLGPARDADDASLRAQAFLDVVDGVRRRGGRAVWTVHNVMPHDGDHPDVERQLRQGLADRADAVHVMCERTAAEVEGHYRLPTERTYVIPHASYVDIYPNVVDRSVARTELGIDGDVPVLLFLGQVRAYKGIGDLLDALPGVRAEHGDVRVVVAGNPGREPGVATLVERVEATPGVDAHLRIIPDDELQIFLNACDLVVLPYRAALNSGALQLALSFGRPVVAAGVGCLPSALSAQTGIAYEDDLVGALVAGLERFTGSGRRRETERACYEAARSYDYLAMGRDFVEMLDLVANVRRQPDET